MNLAEQIKTLNAAKQEAISDAKNYVADVLLALRRHGKGLKSRKWTDPELDMVLDSLDELDKIVPKAQSKKLFKTFQNVDFNAAKKPVEKPEKEKGKATDRRTGKGLGATKETDI